MDQTALCCAATTKIKLRVRHVPPGALLGIVTGDESIGTLGCRSKN